jgi:hypothetical protein
MSISMYQAAVPAFLQMLHSLSAVLDKAEAHAAERKIDQAVLLQYRLAPDMFPLIRQVQIATTRPRLPISGHGSPERWSSCVAFDPSRSTARRSAT